MNTLKRAISLVGVVILFFCISSCLSTKSQTITFVEDPPFKVSNAYSQDWVAGVRGVGSGTNLHVTFSELPEDVVIQNFYFENKKVEALRFPKFRDQFTGYGNHYKGYIKKIKVDPTVVDETAPFELLEDEMVIGYRFDGKRTLHYFKISELYNKPATEYPEIKETGTD
ncbi:hypothetical protein [Ulvibacter antarcticus]|uniref:Uncharacterized protein n=1 Tax=Ulvibacter antarcticus TaxID=442714 RepID=A0A3L9Z6B3_9FLAO|nr:hypothetical protein [Ulvibacter antarcticus]RMA65948.1 hypothetical protein BXY75_0364 [Ulvibacter antarcticus]